MVEAECPIKTTAQNKGGGTEIMTPKLAAIWNHKVLIRSGVATTQETASYHPTLK